MKELDRKYGGSEMEIAIVINEKMINRSLIVKLLYNLKKVKGNKKNAEKRKNLDNEMIIRSSLDFYIRE